MKRVVCFLLALVLAFPAFAQEEEFQKALSKNKKNAAGNFVADFSKQKFTEAEINSCAKNHGYEIVKINYGKIKGYGMVLDGILSVEFNNISTLAKDSDCLSFISEVMAKQSPDAAGRYQGIVSTTDFKRVLTDWFSRSETYFLLDSKQADDYRTRFTFVASPQNYEAIKVHDEIHTIIDEHHILNHHIDFNNILNYYRSNPRSAEVVSDEDASEIVAYFIQYENFPTTKKSVEEALEILPKKVVQAEKFKQYLFLRVARQAWDPNNYSFTRVDFYNRYHEYPGWDSNKLISEDNETYQKIEKEDQIRYYLGLFPNGLHADEVNGWYSGGSFSGWTPYRLDFIRKQAREAESYLRKTAASSSKGQYGVYSEYKDCIKTAPSTDCPADLRKALVFTESLSSDVMDSESQKLFAKFKDYIALINGFWAANQSVNSSGASLVAQDLLASVISPGSAYSLSKYAGSIRDCYKSVAKALEERTIIDSDVDGTIYQIFYETEGVFVKKANNALSSSNSNYRADQGAKSAYDHFEMKDGYTYIYLKNGDCYSFASENGTWHCSSGNGFHPLWAFVRFEGNNDQTAFEQMVDFAVKKNSEFYQ